MIGLYVIAEISEFALMGSMLMCVHAVLTF
jgi:hypothetical protein